MLRRSTLVLCLLLAACGSDSANPDPMPTPQPVACSFDAWDGFCEPASDDFGRPLVCDRGSCVPVWEGKCSPELLAGTCYDPMFPVPPEPGRFGLRCCDGLCVRGECP